MGWQSFIGCMRSTLVRGSNQQPWRQPRKFDKALAVSNTNIGAVQGVQPIPGAAYATALALSAPAANPADGSATSLIVVPLGASDLVELLFYATQWTGSVATPAAAGKTANAYLFLLRESGQSGPANGIDEIGQYVGKLALTAGSNPLVTAAAQPCQAVDTITVTEDFTLSPGIRLTGKPGGGSHMTAAFDHAGAVQLYIVIEPSAIDTTFWGCLSREV